MLKQEDRVISISHANSDVIFTEECDHHFDANYSQDEAIELLMEAIIWILQSK